MSNKNTELTDSERAELDELLAERDHQEWLKKRQEEETLARRETIKFWAALFGATVLVATSLKDAIKWIWSWVP